MDYPFRMCGNTVEIYRYRVDYTEQRDPEGEPETASYCTPYEDDAQYVAQKHNATVVTLDTASYAWLDGLTFDSYEEAAAAHDLGEAAYNAKVQQEQAMTLEAQITDLQLALAELYEKMM